MGLVPTKAIGGPNDANRCFLIAADPAFLDLRDPHDDDRMSRVSAVWALLEEIKGREPSRGELIQVIGAATAGTLNDASCARVADAVLALWNR
jgi:hypothetical protein